jgi:Ca-activated chloride channel family protein
MTLAIQTDRTLIRAAASSTRYVLARITAPRAPERETRLPVNVGIVLDRSGSMAHERKFELAREAVQQSLRMLRSEDRFALVVYDSEIDVLMESTRATPDMQRRALDALRDVGPRGSTNLGGGWLSGCEQIAEFLYDDRVSRCLLLTDGLANQGITDRDELARHAGELRQRGVSTSTFGVGVQFDERLLRDMAHEGGGNFYFIEGASEIPAMITGELGEALEVTLRNASLVVTLPPGATAETLNRFRQTRVGEPNELLIELGDLVSGQELEVVVKVAFPSGALGQELAVGFALASARDTISGTESRQLWTYATHHDNDLQPRNREVDRAVAELYAVRARAEATEANREGRYDHAREVLEATARRILQYAGNDAKLRHLAEQLVDDEHEYAKPMSLSAVKASFYVAETALKARDPSGRARR